MKKKVLAALLTLVMIFSAFNVTVLGVNTTDEDLVDVFVREVFELEHKDEFVSLLLLIRSIDDRTNMLAAYEEVFGGLLTRQQNQLESFGVTLGAMEAFVNDFMDEDFSEVDLNDYLGLDGSPEYSDLFRAALVSREAEFRAGLVAAGADADKLDKDFARIDILFGLFKDARTINSLGFSIPFLYTDAIYSALEVDRIAANQLVGVTNSVLDDDDDIEEGDTVVDGIQSFVDYYNSSTRGDQVEIYDYLDQYGFIKIVLTLPTDAVSILDTVTAPPLVLPGFLDLEDYAWAMSAIEALFGYNVILGRDALTFDPAVEVTRAEFAAMVTRMLELRPSEAAIVFEDITADDWYMAEVQAAYEAGVVKGVSATIFDPETSITRQAMAVMISRALIANGVEVLEADELAALLDEFADKDKINDWAIDGAALTSKLKIVQGLPNDDLVDFKPLANASRAEAAVMLYRMAQNIQTIVVMD